MKSAKKGQEATAWGRGGEMQNKRTARQLEAEGKRGPVHSEEEEGLAVLKEGG